MVAGLDIFAEYFKGYEGQYVLIGGAACDILFAAGNAQFRATRDLDMVLIVEALTEEFGRQFWKFVLDGAYRHQVSYSGEAQFYRFDKPGTEGFPKMVELFSRADFELRELSGLTPVYIDDEVSSLSAILLNEAYYQLLLQGRTVKGGLSVLRPEYLILFKAKAYLDLSERKSKGEQVDSTNIRKHKNDILRITVELVLEKPEQILDEVKKDMKAFLEQISISPFDANILKGYGLTSDRVLQRLEEVYGQ